VFVLGRRHTESLEEMQLLFGGPNQVTCYAESRDGIRWTKPELGLVEFKGSSQNNIVWKDRGYAERNDDWGKALSAGWLSLSSEWVFSGTGLRLSLSGENNEVLFAAELNDIKARTTASF
jgi:hypothetical protein